MTVNQEEETYALANPDLTLMDPHDIIADTTEEEITQGMNSEFKSIIGIEVKDVIPATRCTPRSRRCIRPGRT